MMSQMQILMVFKKQQLMLFQPTLNFIIHIMVFTLIQFFVKDVLIHTNVYQTQHAVGVELLLLVSLIKAEEHVLNFINKKMLLIGIHINQKFHLQTQLFNILLN
jgi:hypothetical protein